MQTSLEAEPVAVAPALPAAFPAAQALPPPSSTERFQFTGQAGEYFGIWVVNLFLTIVTLGIYSAWAKVRKRRYFYGNTWVAGANFEYHGNPIAILKGRLLAFAVFVAYTLAAQFSQRLSAVVLLAIMPAVPWLLVRSYAFNAVNSSYRNVRFHFRARYADALAAIAPFFVIPVLALALPEMDAQNPPQGPGDLWMFMVTPLAFALFYPYVAGKLRLLRINRARFGVAPFRCAATIRDFYVVFGLAALLFAVLAALFGVMMAPILAIPWLGIGALPLLYVALGAVVLGYTQSRVANLVFNRTSLEARVRFASALSARRLAAIYATNVLAIVGTLGLAIPWAAIRTARYRATCLSAQCEGGWESFLGEVAAEVGAAGEEMGEMFDVDLAL